jgi:RNA polymerase sigma-70 factor (ECF subfamily)
MALPRSDAAFAVPDRARPFPAEPLADTELVHLAAAGDGAAMGVIWDRYAARVRRLLWHLLGGERDLDDVVQDVFLELVARLDTLRDPGALRPFLFAIATNRGRSEIRRRRVRRIISLTSSGELPEPGPASGSEASHELSVALAGVLSRLSSRDRSLFLLRFVEGLEHAEVAAALGVSLRTAKRDAERVRARVAELALDHPVLARHKATPEGEEPLQ